MKPSRKIPLFGIRKFAAALISELEVLSAERDAALQHLSELGGLTILELERKRLRAEEEAKTAQAQLLQIHQQLEALRARIVHTEDAEILQEVGVYSYAHPLSDAVAYQSHLANLDDQIKSMNRKDGGAIRSDVGWEVNGSVVQGRIMVREFSKLMLRAFNAEADNMVRGLKPYKLHSATDRLIKVAETIAKLGRTMSITIEPRYLQLRLMELELTADYLQKQAEEKEVERAERERLKEERKAQQELERERLRLEKERLHYINALRALEAKGDLDAAERMRAQLSDVDRAISDIDYRAANIRAGYVYVISNIGPFGESLIKVGMTRRLDPMDRVRELGDASVPFNFDVHALFFSQDAVGIESAMHGLLAQRRCNLVNLRREFFHATPAEAKDLLAQLAGDVLSFHDIAEALEFRQTQDRRNQQWKEDKTETKS